MASLRVLLAPLGVALLALQACATPATPAPSATVAPAPAGPALWKVADEDTTIYLFGTVHALPEDVDWLRGDIAAALGEADEFVTELPIGAGSDPATQSAIDRKAKLPEDASLRDLLDPQQRATYEEALGTLGMPPAEFDSYEPWFAAMTLNLIPLLKAGYSPESGVEQVLAAQAEGKSFAALETLEQQIDVFDGMPMDAQIAYLVALSEGIANVVPLLDEMVVEWAAGDVDALAALMTRGYADPVLFERLLYRRNRVWAEWIETRLDTPGTVFVAVGAAHLAGENSVQDYVAARGLSTDRVQ